jgi:hypothetical protein
MIKGNIKMYRMDQPRATYSEKEEVRREKKGLSQMYFNV